MDMYVCTAMDDEGGKDGRRLLADRWLAVVAAVQGYDVPSVQQGASRSGGDGGERYISDCTTTRASMRG